MQEERWIRGRIVPHDLPAEEEDSEVSGSQAGNTDKAQHPIYAPGVSQQIRDEYEGVKDERDSWLSAFMRTESEAERYQMALEAIRDHGTDSFPCHAAFKGDCEDTMREIARTALLSS